MTGFLLRAILWVLSAGATLLFGALAFRRCFHPLELDPFEGVLMDHVVRLSQGQGIYVQPTLSFVPLTIMPIYPTLASLLARIFTAPEFWEPRVISLLAVIATAVLAVRIVRSETESWTMAAGALAVYLMGFGLSGGAYDVARPDSLMLLFVLGALASLRFSTAQAGAVGAALLFALAFFTQQSALIFLLAAFAHVAINERHRLLVFALWVAVFAGGGFFGLASLLGPWFSFYTLDVPFRWAQFDSSRTIEYLGPRLLGHLGLLAAATVVSLALPVRPWRGRDGLWMWIGLGALVSGLVATLDPQAPRSVLMPTLLVFSILGPISLHRIALELTATRTAQMRPTMAIMCGVVALQLLPLVYSVGRMLPRPRAAEARAAFIDKLRQHPGNVLVPHHGFYSWLAGKGTSLHVIALGDLLRAPGNSVVRFEPQFFDRMFEPLREGGDRPAIFTDVRLTESGGLWTHVESGYTLTGNLGWLSEPLQPVSANSSPPAFVYVPRVETPPPSVSPASLATPDSAAALMPKPLPSPDPGTQAASTTP